MAKKKTNTENEPFDVYEAAPSTQAAPDEKPIVEFKHVSKTYDNGTKALDNVDITVKKGEFVFVVGASGAGKSTFLKLLMREEVPSGGSIRVMDYNLGTLPKKKIPYFRRKMGIVFQDFRLIPTMTVYDNVAFAMRVIGTKEAQIRKRVPFVLSLIGLSNKARSLPQELSGGEQQRVALARALSNNAEIIIADEPTGNVDPQMSLEIVELLTRLNDGGTTVILVTHAHELVQQFERRVVILEHGRVIYDGNSKDSGDYLQSSNGHLDRAYIEDFSQTFAISSQDGTAASLDASISKFNAASAPAEPAAPEAPADFTVYIDKSSGSDSQN